MLRCFIYWLGSFVDNSGQWGRGGMFDAIAKLSSSIHDAYQRASEFEDLHLGDLHLIRINGLVSFSFSMYIRMFIS